MIPRTNFDSEHEIFRASVRQFFQAEVAPRVMRWREQGVVDRDIFTRAGEQGYLLMWAPEEYGGVGIDDMRYEQILQEENYLHGDPGLCLTLHSRVVAPYIGKRGSEAQKQRWLPPAIRGEKILAVAMSEPSAGSDLAGMKTRAEDRGDHWVLSGSKTYISNGLLADLVIVAARTSGPSKHSMGLFVVEAAMEGFRRGRKLHKLGLDAQDTAEMFFDEVKVPKENALGDPTEGFRYLAEALAVERLQIAIGSIAHAQVAFDLTLEYVKERKAFGRPVGTFQDPRFRLARMRAELDALQCYIDHCVMLSNAGRLTAEVASGAKMLATELEGRVIDDCLQLHGGAGYMEEYRICRMFRDARVTRIFGGANEIMAEIIGRGLGLDERKLMKPQPV
ncbi:acyl-CoA dehydrogenase family protein [Chondromyces apiculatus]|uniref:Acyl-CoA dehydrogenase, short-chain specific n=1 Tax=Chondromyces apiculatus DSM 436 TaxID=1192034 RepID=A0A017TF19_9BACT|nr:acyl-CoA dehydrogenase family protein [Chondromyces apiculatus]EYF07497.1 Acyl-CoA dehydrogenase, short-chain specific [Chondromyces apiculatus DSM 436]